MHTILFYILGLAFSSLYIFLLSINIYLAILIGFVLGFLTSIFLIILSVLVFAPILKKMPLNSRFKKFYCKSVAQIACNLIGVKIKVVGKENIPLNQTFVVCPNHKSLTDVLTIYRVFPMPLGFAAKKSLDKVPIIRTYMKAIGCVLIDRESDRNTAVAIVTAVKQIKDGYSMCVFPEGGIKSRDTSKMVSVKAGAYKMATKTNVPIVPVSIQNSNLISKRSPWRRTKVTVTIHKPILSEKYQELSTIEIGDKVFEIVNSVLED